MNKIFFPLLFIFLNAILAESIENLETEISNQEKNSCPIGFFGDPQKEECLKIPDNVCETNPCGENSVCFDDKNDQKVINMGPYCLCEANTIGHPPNCKKRCNSDNHCEDEEFCDITTGKCEIGCRFDHSKCKFDEYCDTNIRQCIKGCRSNHENCKNNEICNIDTLTCTIGCRNDDNCTIGEFCELYNGKCISGCRTDDNCAQNEYCEFHSSKCLVGCSLDENCQFDEYCDSNTRNCTKGCRITNENCKFNEFCNEMNRTCEVGCNLDIQCNPFEYCNENHKCENICSESKCGPNSICTVNNFQVFCSCKDGFIPEKNIGCRERMMNETNIEFQPHKNRFTFCQNFCSDGSSCGYFNKTIYCACSNDRVSNSFLECKPVQLLFGSPVGGLCDCCTENIKPGCEMPIDPNLLKSLVG
ncbi:hypothetical protein PVAND_007807 [Polypedilum vanderplanki]|uniref:EGF-like domain-containing protein n=1 Tax=Polypedilum vanderplanki TaxID=319348 RepID=A0A9J6C7U2_POLVA|nr:hypothetical protein PVAND_007807 [Polypedilum vanderplanki]